MDEPELTIVAGVELNCKHCGGGTFVYRYIHLNTAGLNADGPDWQEEFAHVYVCRACGYFHWFLANPAANENTEEFQADDNYEIQCMSCGRTIPAGASSCPACGWSYEGTGVGQDWRE